MNHWRQRVLDHFQAPFFPLTLASDPDRLLDDERIVARLKELGFDIVVFQDRASFRFDYESRYNDPSARSVQLLVVAASASLSELPYDIWIKGQQVELHKGSLFPQLNDRVVCSLDTRTLDLLSAVPITGHAASERAAIDFILKHAYGLAYDSVQSLADCLQLVIRWHRLQCDVPDMIREYLTDCLRQRMTDDMPVHEWIASFERFASYLQREWNKFVEAEFPQRHPFTDPSVRAFLSLLFAEGVLTPAAVQHDRFPPAYTWGVSHDRRLHKAETLIRLQQQLETLLAAPTDRRSWIQIARIYGKAKNLALQLQLEDEAGGIAITTEHEMEARFERWLAEHYGALATLTDRNAPVMVHKAVEVLRLKEKAKIALVVCDGMSFVQWAQIEQALVDDFRCDVYGSFAWIPTLTSVSRQSIFSGDIPRFFKGSIHTTAADDKAWKSVWERNGVPSGFVTYERGLGQAAYDRAKIAALAKSTTKVAGLVVDTIDQLTHHTIQGQLGLYAAAAVWLKQRYLQSLLADLLDAGYDVYITSDHGNKESKGVGRASDGALSEIRGERARIYRHVVLRDQAAVQYSSKPWSGAGLPDDCHVLVARPGEAFVREGETVVCHGGASLEEVVVPFVHIQYK